MTFFSDIRSAFMAWCCRLSCMYICKNCFYSSFAWLKNKTKWNTRVSPLIQQNTISPFTRKTKYQIGNPHGKLYNNYTYSYSFFCFTLASHCQPASQPANHIPTTIYRIKLNYVLNTRKSTVWCPIQHTMLVDGSIYSPVAPAKLLLGTRWTRRCTVRKERWKRRRQRIRNWKR